MVIASVLIQRGMINEEVPNIISPVEVTWNELKQNVTVPILKSSAGGVSGPQDALSEI